MKYKPWRDENYSIDHYEESLEVTPQGKYLLAVEGGRDHMKYLTVKQPQLWFAKRYPRRSWKRIEEGVDGWLESKKAA